jgi:hypothetical protein
MSYQVTVIMIARIEKRSSGERNALVSEVAIPMVRTNGAPSATYAVHEIEAAAADALASIVKMVEAAHGRSKRPDWEC